MEKDEKEVQDTEKKEKECARIYEWHDIIKAILKVHLRSCSNCLSMNLISN